MAGIYPTETPGGWNLLGRMSETLWDDTREQPNLIAPGDIIRIVPGDRVIGDRVLDVVPRAAQAGRPRVRPSSSRGIATVLQPGQQTLIVNSGDVRRLRVGLSESGAFDADAARAANRAAGNEEDAFVLECTFVGPTLRFHGEALIAMAGAPAVVTVGGNRATGKQWLLRAGEELAIGAISDGVRCSLAIRGGWENPAAPFAIQPFQLRSGDELANSETQRTMPPSFRELDRHEPLRIDVLRGPDPIDEDVLHELLGSTWRVLDGSRRGVRLQSDASLPGGPPLLPSAGALFGTVQWHPDGSLTILGPEHPVTGGYAQPFVLPRAQLWKVAQLRRGQSLQLRLTQ
jgi:allophanate hydrolase subunit 2